MSSDVEPGMAEFLARVEEVRVDWSAFRKCPTCRAGIGEPCRTADYPPGAARVLPHAHGFRQRRVKR